MGDDAGLAGAGAGPGQDEEGAVRVLHGLPLSRVEGGEDGAAGGGGHKPSLAEEGKRMKERERGWGC